MNHSGQISQSQQDEEHVNITMLGIAIDRARATAITLIFGYVVVAAIGFYHDNTMRGTALLIVMGGLMVAAWRYLLHRHWHATSDKPLKRTTAEWNFVGMALLGGAVNMFAILSIYVNLPPIDAMIVLLVMMGALSVATLFLSLVRFGMAAYMLPAFLAMMYLCLFVPHTKSYALALVLPIYLAISFHAAIENRKSIREGIWQRLRLEENARALEIAKIEAEAGNRAKSQFLANMSHEVRTPMSGMLGSLELIEDGELSAGQKRWLEVARSSGMALISVINDVLDYSKLEVGQLALLKEPFDLHASIYNASTMLTASAKRKDIVLAVNIEANVPQYVMGDRVRLGQVLLNLIGNAVKFTEHGAVTVRTSVLPASSLPAGNDNNVTMIVIDVADTGMGIAPDQLNQIFAPFHQVDQSDSRIKQGTGLGLSIVKQLVIGMGGETRVSSGLGKGSMFTVTIPFAVTQISASVPARVDKVGIGLANVAPKPMNKLSSQPRIDAGYSQYRVLIAEDNAINLIVLLRILERLNIVADEAYDGEEAVRKWRQNHYDAILMDCQMPNMDGFEATSIIREEEKGDIPRARTPIIAITANALTSDRERCLQIGMDGYLAKPFRIEELQTVLKDYLPNVALNIHSAAD